MIHAEPTKKGTGIKFWGDRNDLKLLYDCVSNLCHSNNNEADYERNARLLTILPYEIRHAYQGDSLKKEEDNGDGTTIYYGFQINWITLLYSISALRYNAAYQCTSLLEQAQLNIIEYWTKVALNCFDAVGANEIECFVGCRIDVSSKYVYIIYEYVVAEYLSMPNTKKRFQNIPYLLSKYATHTDRYKNIVNSIEEDIKNGGGSISDFSVTHIPDVKIW